MFLDPELIPRALHWADVHDVRCQEWNQVLPALGLPGDEHRALARAMRAFASAVAALPDHMQQAGVEADVIEQCRHSIDTQAEQLARVQD
jgi:serine/threonine-protein kinase HipA